MVTLVLAYALLAFSLLACLLAFVVGGAAERLGAGAILMNLLAGMANERLYRDPSISLVIDGATAVILLPLVICYVSAWLGAVMILYGLEFALHAYYAVLSKPRDLWHARLNNLDFLAISTCLVAGAVLAWRRRRLSTSAP